MISQFKSRKALKRIRMMKLKKKKMNTLIGKYRYENSPKRNLLNVLDARGLGQQRIQNKIAPSLFPGAK